MGVIVPVIAGLNPQSSWQLLDKQVGATRSDSAGVTHSYTLPGGLMEENSIIRLTYLTRCPVSSSGVIKPYCGWGTVTPTNTRNTNPDTDMLCVFYIANNDSLSAQLLSSNLVLFHAPNTVLLDETAAEDTANDVDIVFGADGITAGEDHILVFSTVEIVF